MRLAVIKNLILFAPRLHWKLLILCFISIFVLSASIVAYIHRTQIKTDLNNFAILHGFTPKIINIEGVKKSDPRSLDAVLNNLKEQSIFSIDLTALRQQIMSIGWIKDAHLRRTLPDTLTIKLTEREPIALLQIKNGAQLKYQLIDKTGTIIGPVQQKDFPNLIITTGLNAPANIHQILSILKTKPTLYRHVWAVQYISQRRWNVYFKGGIVIKLPEQKPANAWAELAQLDHENSIMRRDLAAIDLRVPGQLIVEPNLVNQDKGNRS